MLKNIHLTCIGLTFLSFTLRFIWMLRKSDYLLAPVSRILPHIIDTTLLFSAIGLTILLQQYPITNVWLTAKICGLLVYILAGTMALKRGKTRSVRIFSGIVAYTAFVYIIAVAVTKSALIVV
jgi:uncharacterized membrane protein SirB2